jgi:hypothetical protein
MLVTDLRIIDAFLIALKAKRHAVAFATTFLPIMTIAENAAMFAIVDLHA